MGTATVNGLDLHYDVTGDGPPLALITGYGITSGIWMNQVPAWAEHHTVITIDNRDSGESGHASGPYTIADMAADVVGVLDHLEIDRAHVAGFSLGGYIAQELAIRHGERVDRLVLLSTAADLARYDGLTFAAMWSRIRRADPDLLPSEVAMWALSPAARANAEVVEQFTAAAGGMLATYSDDSYARQADAINGFDASDRLGSITAPTLVVVGELDILTPIADAEELANGIPDAKLERLPGGAHAALLEVPDALNRTVLRFLAA